MTKVFLSVSHKDLSFADRLYSDLCERGIEVWLYSYQEAGYLITRRIDSELDSADFFCAVCSEHYFDSANCQEELAMARTLLNSSTNTKLKRIIPILIGPCDLPPSLQARVYLDFREDAYECNLNQLVSAIQTDSVAPAPSIEESEVALDKDYLQSEILEFIHAEQIVNLEEEVRLFREMLAPDGTPPILFIEAPSGRGKTWLLYLYLHICRGEGLRTSYIDFRDGFFRDYQAVVDSIIRQIDIGWKGMSIYELRGVLRSLAEMEEGRNLVFLFDTVEKAQEIEQWLVESLLVPIRDGRLQNLRLVFAGLRSLQLAHEEEWLGVVEHRYGLPLWRVEHIQHFAQANGLHIGRDEAQFIYRGTRGFPNTCAVFVKNLLRS